MGVPASQRGPFTPMRYEATIEDCLVEGDLPDDLFGGFYRNGPTWRRPQKQGCETAYPMDGMVQGLVFREGRVEFRNRWVRTPKYLAEERAGRSLFAYTDGEFDDWRSWSLGDVVRDEFTTGIPQGTNAINAMPFAGEVLALGEVGGPPIALDPITLQTRGVAAGPNISHPGCTSPRAPATAPSGRIPSGTRRRVSCGGAPTATASRT